MVSLYCLAVVGLEKWLVYIVNTVCAHRKSWDSSVTVASELSTGQSAFGLPAGARDFSFLWNIQSGCGSHPAFYSVGTGGLFLWGYSSWGLELTAHLPLVLRLEMSGAVLVLTTYPHGADWGNCAEVRDEWSCTCADYIPTWCGLGKLYLNLLYRYRCKLNWRQSGHHGFMSCFSISITPRLMTWLRKHQPVWPKAWLASLYQYWRRRCRSCRDMTREAWLDPSLALRYAFWWQTPSI